MRRRFPVRLGVLFLVGMWLGLPAITYRSGTSQDVSVTVLAQPFIGSDALVYEWSGDVFRSCEVDLRRQIIDADSTITLLTPRVLEALPPSMLGRQTYEVRVDVPLRIAEGPALYQVTEIPKCNWMQRLWPVEVPYPPVNFTVTRKENT